MQPTPSVHGTGPTATGQVVLDIGGSSGAAIVFTSPELCGQEMEIRAAGSDWAGTHVGVCERHVAGGPCWAALFGPLWEGVYETRLKEGGRTAVLSLRVEGGRVTTAQWPAP